MIISLTGQLTLRLHGGRRCTLVCLPRRGMLILN